mmetsp:Transcript_3621/g.11119  ORF Transcript_3621/g.11119 Transcript_3621/m.11119 type:complete len:227 (+) Transcript_3621:2706-3386(+)
MIPYCSLSSLLLLSILSFTPLNFSAKSAPPAAATNRHVASLKYFELTKSLKLTGFSIQNTCALSDCFDAARATLCHLNSFPVSSSSSWSFRRLLLFPPVPTPLPLDADPIFPLRLVNKGTNFLPFSSVSFSTNQSDLPPLIPAHATTTSHFMRPGNATTRSSSSTPSNVASVFLESTSINRAIFKRPFPSQHSITSSMFNRSDFRACLDSSLDKEKIGDAKVDAST